MPDYISRDDVLKAIDYQHEVNNVFESEAAYVQMWETINDDIGIKSADVQPVKRGHWIEKSEEYYRLWQDSGRSWDDMPYFVTGLNFACSCCFNQYDVNAEGVEEWDFCPKCGADMREHEPIKG